MAYLNEFPNFEAPQRNLDFILEQYSTFNKRIKEINDHFDEAVATIQGEVEELNNDFEEFKETVNNNFDVLSEDLQGKVEEAIKDIQRQIDLISDNMVEYINAHIEDWYELAILPRVYENEFEWVTTPSLGSHSLRGFNYELCIDSLSIGDILNIKTSFSNRQFANFDIAYLTDEENGNYFNYTFISSDGNTNIEISDIYTDDGKKYIMITINDGDTHTDGDTHKGYITIPSGHLVLE